MVLLIWAISWAVTPAMPLTGSLRQIPVNYVSRLIEEISFVIGVGGVFFILLYYSNLNVDVNLREWRQ